MARHTKRNHKHRNFLESLTYWNNLNWHRTNKLLCSKKSPPTLISNQVYLTLTSSTGFDGVIFLDSSWLGVDVRDILNSNMEYYRDCSSIDLRSFEGRGRGKPWFTLDKINAYKRNYSGEFSWRKFTCVIFFIGLRSFASFGSLQKKVESFCYKITERSGSNFII